MQKKTIEKVNKTKKTYLVKYLSEKGETIAQLIKAEDAFKAEKKLKKERPSVRLTNVRYIE